VSVSVACTDVRSIYLMSCTWLQRLTQVAGDGCLSAATCLLITLQPGARRFAGCGCRKAGHGRRPIAAPGAPCKGCDVGVSVECVCVFSGGDHAYAWSTVALC
jgi:hypothetical protein